MDLDVRSTKVSYFTQRFSQLLYDKNLPISPIVPPHLHSSPALPISSDRTFRHIPTPSTEMGHLPPPKKARLGDQIYQPFGGSSSGGPQYTSLFQQPPSSAPPSFIPGSFDTPVNAGNSNISRSNRAASHHQQYRSRSHTTPYDQPHYPHPAHPGGHHQQQMMPQGGNVTDLLSFFTEESRGGGGGGGGIASWSSSSSPHSGQPDSSSSIPSGLLSPSVNISGFTF
jgi:hypothetical protein